MLKMYEFDYLESVLQKAERYLALQKQIADLPEGSLIEWESRKGKKQFYLSTYMEGVRSRRYLSIRENDELIGRLKAKKAGAAEMREELRFLAAYLKSQRGNITRCMANLEMRRYSFPVTVSQNPKFRDELRHKTLHGEFVRNKAERGWANGFLSYGIPYKYEQPFIFENSEPVFPDFDIQHPLHGKMCVFEHKGWESEGYFTRWEHKAKLYKRAGLVEGRDLFVVSEEDALDVGGFIERTFTPKRYEPITEALKTLE